MAIIVATEKDIPELVSLMDSAYRGEESKKGWTSEADIIHGNKRTDETTVTDLMKSPGSVFLKYTNEQNKIVGCVFLSKKENKLYLGMLCVCPEVQAKGIGKKFLSAAEEFAHANKCHAIYMTVISLRKELIAWYEKHGYHQTGVTVPFPEDERFGIPIQPLEMLVLEKALT